MNINPNQAMFQAEYFRNLYADQNLNNAGQIRPDVERADNQKDERDIAIISEEARRMQRSTKALGSNESSLDQQREMLVPGQIQTEMQPRSGIEAENHTVNRVEQPREPETVSYNEQLTNDMAVQSESAQREDNVDTNTGTRESSIDEVINRNENLQNNSSVEANINNINLSSQIQAYASAANLTQATMIVNHKV